MSRFLQNLALRAAGAAPAAELVPLVPRPRYHFAPKGIQSDLEEPVFDSGSAPASPGVPEPVGKRAAADVASSRIAENRGHPEQPSRSAPVAEGRRSAGELPGRPDLPRADAPPAPPAARSQANAAPAAPLASPRPAPRPPVAAAPSPDAPRSPAAPAGQSPPVPLASRARPPAGEPAVAASAIEDGRQSAGGEPGRAVTAPAAPPASAGRASSEPGAGTASPEAPEETAEVWLAPEPTGILSPRPRLSRRDAGPPAVTVSIGRIDLEMVPPAPTAATARPGPQRTRGFEGYDAARRGHRR